MDALRGHRRPVTAARLADDLSVSVRTVYRDIQTLIDLGAPVEGEAGLGYLLRAGFDKIADTGLWAPRFQMPAEQPTGLRTIREAMRREYKLAITYVDEKGATTERVVWPIALAFLEGRARAA